jgi:hypothetical protein
MTKLEKIEREIEALPAREMRALAAWFSDLREGLWEREIEAGSPEMDALAARALDEHQAGKTTPLVRRCFTARRRRSALIRLLSRIFA